MGASAQDNEKKVPPRHPNQRLAKLNKFAREWCTTNLTEKQANHWIEKFDRNVVRFERRWELCGFYDENQLPHGGPKPEERKRREDDDDDILPRYDKNNPVTGIKQITMGFKNGQNDMSVVANSNQKHKLEDHLNGSTNSQQNMSPTKSRSKIGGNTLKYRLIGVTDYCTMIALSIEHSKELILASNHLLKPVQYSSLFFIINSFSK